MSELLRVKGDIVGQLLEPEEEVLSTLRRDGSRRWLKPRLSHGRYLLARRVVAYMLLALYTTLPWVRVSGRPAVLLDLPKREFVLFGAVFLPTDNLLFALLMMGGLLAFFWATALAGRVWCGWGCPQTVYLEFVFRPIERLFEGTAGRGGRPRTPPSGARRAGKLLAFLLVTFVVANTFLAYFVGTDVLIEWMTSSPFKHPVGFGLMAFVTALMFFDFAYFREQMCILTCPYGRLQSVLLDEHSLVVHYDTKRGEPRGRVSDSSAGDCVDCKRCITTCPTGIDIRNGLQMECINCTQCIDACDDVMTKVGRPKGLIRFDSQANAAGNKRRLVRARTLAYPLAIAVLGGIFVQTWRARVGFDAALLRNPGNPFVLAEDGEAVTNGLRVKLTNRTQAPHTYTISVADPPSVQLTILMAATLGPGEAKTIPATATIPRDAFVRGELPVRVHIADDTGATRELLMNMLGPTAGALTP